MSDCTHFVAVSEDGPYCKVGYVHPCAGCEDYTPWCKPGILDEEVEFEE